MAFYKTHSSIVGTDDTYWNGLQDNTSSPLVLILHENLGMPALLVRALLEHLAEALQRNIVAIKVKGLKIKRQC